MSCSRLLPVVLFGMLSALMFPLKAEAMTAAELAQMLPWKGVDGQGVRLHFLPSDMGPGKARGIVAKYDAALTRLEKFYMMVPAKKVDIFLAPRGKGPDRAYLFAKTWAVLGTWHGPGCVEELFPGRIISRVFTAVLAGEGRSPHPFVLEALCRIGADCGFNPHKVLLQRLRADGIQLPIAVTTADLAAERDISALKAASLVDFIGGLVGRKKLAGLPSATWGFRWDDYSRRSRWANAVVGLTGMTMAVLVSRWNAFLRKTDIEIDKVDGYLPAARRALAAYNDRIEKFLLYRDEPLLEFAAVGESGETCLLRAGRGKLEVVRKTRNSPVRLKGFPGRQSCLTSLQLRRIREFFRKRVDYVSSGMNAALKKQYRDTWLTWEEKEKYARLLAVDLGEMTLESVDTVFRVRSVLDMDADCGSYEVFSYFIFRNGRPKLVEERWRRIRRAGR